MELIYLINQNQILLYLLYLLLLIHLVKILQQFLQIQRIQHYPLLLSQITSQSMQSLEEKEVLLPSLVYDKHVDETVRSAYSSLIDATMSENEGGPNGWWFNNQ